MWSVASFVPPPEARRQGCQVHQAMAYGIWASIDGEETGRWVWERTLTAAV